MAMFVHLAPQSQVALIRRNGIRRLRRARRDSPGGVFAVPVTRNFFISHQWLRELKRRNQGAIAGIYFRIPDHEQVWVGHYNQSHRWMSAAQAVAEFMSAEDAQGWEVVIPRRIEPAEVHRVRRLPQVVGWRSRRRPKVSRPIAPASSAHGATTEPVGCANGWGRPTPINRSLISHTVRRTSLAILARTADDPAASLSRARSTAGPNSGFLRGTPSRQPVQQSAEIALCKRLLDIADFLTHLGHELRREDIPQCVSRKIAEHPRGPMSILQTAFGIVARHHAQIMAIGFLPGTGQFRCASGRR